MSLVIIKLNILLTKAGGMAPSVKMSIGYLGLNDNLISSHLCTLFQKRKIGIFQAHQERNNWVGFMPIWNEHSLEEHFDKRMRKDSACWQDLLSRPVAAIQRTEYESTSLEVMDKAWIQFSGESMDVKASRSGPIS